MLKPYSGLSMPCKREVPGYVCVQFKPAISQDVRREVGQALAKLTASKHNIDDVSPCTRCAGRRSTMCYVHRKANAEASKSTRTKRTGGATPDGQQREKGSGGCGPACTTSSAAVSR